MGRAWFTPLARSRSVTAFDVGIRLYLLVLAFIATLTIVWATNGFLLDNTTRATGWPLLIGITGVFVTLGVLFHYLRSTNDSDPTLAPYPWSSIDRE